MEDIAKLIPNSITTLIGIAVIMGILVMLGTIFQEWAKSLYRRTIMGGKEKRKEQKLDYDGIERRSHSQKVEEAILDLVAQIKTNNLLIERFIQNWKERVPDAIDAVEEIKRKQDKNWERLFNEELPSIRST